MTVAVGLGDDFVRDDEDHRAGCESRVRSGDKPARGRSRGRPRVASRAVRAARWRRRRGPTCRCRSRHYARPVPPPVLPASPAGRSPWSAASRRKGRSGQKLTPIAMPSGKLCKATAKTNSQMRPQRSGAGPQGPVLSCSCGVKLSRPSMSSTPSAMPENDDCCAEPLVAGDLGAGSEAREQTARRRWRPASCRRPVRAGCLRAFAGCCARRPRVARRGPLR